MQLDNIFSYNILLAHIVDMWIYVNIRPLLLSCIITCFLSLCSAKTEAGDYSLFIIPMNHCKVCLYSYKVKIISQMRFTITVMLKIAFLQRIARARNF